MGREPRIALDYRYRSRPPALVRRRELLGTAEREGRDDLERERRGMIVVDQDHDVGRVVADPLLGEFVALEQRPPVRVLRLAVIERGADCRHMRGRQARVDPSHYCSAVAASSPLERIFTQSATG